MIPDTGTITVTVCGNCGSDDVRYYRGDSTKCHDCGAVDCETTEERKVEEE